MFNNFFKTKGEKIMLGVLGVLVVLVVFSIFFGNSIINARNENDVIPVATYDEVKPATRDEVTTTAPETTEPLTTAPATTKPKETKPKETTAPATTAQPTTKAPAVQFATAIPVANPADHGAQLAAGYLIAIDNPDKSYACAQITLCDADRDLLERLCMGEFGSGGFTGACLIAQSVKDAMSFDGFRSVAEIIKDYHYTGSTSIAATQECKDAVKYIFDQNHDAVQHRILYMYNPSMVSSSFHESQNFILSYGGVRFFDRWGY